MSTRRSPLDSSLDVSLVVVVSVGVLHDLLLAVQVEDRFSAIECVQDGLISSLVLQRSNSILKSNSPSHDVPLETYWTWRGCQTNAIPQMCALLATAQQACLQTWPGRGGKPRAKARCTQLARNQLDHFSSWWIESNSMTHQILI
eukprot:2947864-Amphidinium_carterae.1